MISIPNSNLYYLPQKKQKQKKPKTQNKLGLYYLENNFSAAMEYLTSKLKPKVNCQSTSKERDNVKFKFVYKDKCHHCFLPSCLLNGKVECLPFGQCQCSKL